MKYWLWRAAFWLWFVTDGYYLWSRWWRWLVERQYRRTRPTLFADWQLLSERLGQMQWRQDPVKGLFDVISTPSKVEAKFQTGQPVGDCDEFAAYAAHSFNKLDRYFPEIMTVNWLDRAGRFHGHNVCAYYDDVEGQWYHMSNWGQGRRYGPFFSREETAREIAGTGRLIGWATVTPDLRHKTCMRIGHDPDPTAGS